MPTIEMPPELILKSIEEFGAMGDGVTNDTQAFQQAAAFINNNSGGVRLTFRPVTYIIGAQNFNNTTPSYLYVAQDILKIENCNNPVYFEGNGARIKVRDGLRFGIFNVDGSIKTTQMPYYGTANVNDIAAYPLIFELNYNKNIHIKNMIIDGNCSNAIIGGQYGDTGWQLPGDGIFATSNDNLLIENVQSINHCRDGLMVRNNAITENEPTQFVTLFSSKFLNNTRQGFSWIGGNDCHATNCEFSETGQTFNVSLGRTMASAPAAGIDIEPEGISPVNGMIATFIDLVGGSNYTDGTYHNVPLVGGSGRGAKAKIVITNGTITSVSTEYAHHVGVDYQTGDVLTAPSLPHPGGTSFSIKIGSIFAGEKWLYGIHGRFDNCIIANNKGVGFLADSGSDNSYDVECNYCTFVGSENWSVWVTKPHYRFNYCEIVGSIVHAFLATGRDDVRRTKWFKCHFLYDRNRNRLPVGTQVYVDQGAEPFALFEQCTFDANEMPLPWTWSAEWNNCNFRNNSIYPSFTKGYFTGINRFECGNVQVDFYGAHFLGQVIYNGVDISSVKPIKLGSTALKGIKLGSSKITKIYRGENEIWADPGVL